jgi:hypothetical protein
MSATDLERQLRSFLAEGPVDPQAAVVERALAEARTLPQVRTLELPWSHLPRLTLPEPQALVRVGLVTAVLVAAVLIGIWGFSGVPIPPAESPSPSLAPAPSPSSSPGRATPAPTTDISATPAPDLTPPPPTFAVPRDLGWQQLSGVEGIPTDVLLNDLLSTEAGYVAVGRLAEDISSWSSWFSSDGNSWSGTRFERPQGCSSDAETAAAASSPGRGVLVISSSGCPDASAVAHQSPDGTSWSTGVPFGSGAPVAVWSAPRGWEALLGSFEAGSELWASADGLNWTRTAAVTEPGRSAYRGAASVDGTRLVAVNDRNGQTELLRSDDGVSWEVVAGAFGHVLEIEPPGASSGWLVAADPDLAAIGVNVWRSSDLTQWTPSISLQRNLGFSNIASTRYGSLFSGVEGCWRTGDEPRLCIPSDAAAYTQYLSGDGVEWFPFTTALPTAKRDHFMADGPAGVVAVQLTDAGGLAVWQLAPEPGPRWEEVGRIDSEDDDFRLIGFDAGYVAWIDFSSRAWYSADGVDWQPADLPENEVACEGEVQPNQIEAAASSGDTVVLIGSLLVPGPTDTFCWLQSVSWWTSDGLNWERSAPFGQLRALSESRPQAVWSAGGGFEAAVASHRGPEGDVSETVIWRSADGQEWTAVTSLEGAGDVVVGTSSGGARVISVSGTTLSGEGSSYFQMLLAASTDGVEWSPLPSPRTGWVVTEILPPTQPSDDWSVLATEEDGSTRGVFYSADLSNWTEQASPSDELYGLARTREGIVATGCASDATECRQYLTSGPSATWQEVPPALGTVRAIDGPAGVLAVVGWPSPTDDFGTVLRLVP